MNLVDNFRDYRSKKLEKIAKAVANIGIKANHITTLSLITGILGVYYLFNNYYLLSSVRASRNSLVRMIAVMMTVLIRLLFMTRNSSGAILGAAVRMTG